MSETPKISIIIPVYEDPAGLELCLNSLQRSKHIEQSEIIVVDDCSPDHGTLIREITNKHAAKYCRQSVNRGPGIARNRGAEEASGAILVFIDADCLAPPDWLSKITQPIIDGLFVATTSCYCGPVHPTWLTIFQDEDYQYRMPSDKRYVSFVNSCNFAVSREVFLKCGGFPEQRIAHDMVLGMILADNGTPAWYLPGAGVQHDYHEDIYSYLRQRYTFAYNTVRSLLDRQELQRKKSPNKNKSFSPIRTAAGMFFNFTAIFSFISAMISAIFGYGLTILFIIAGATSLLLEVSVHSRFLKFLITHRVKKNILSYILLLYLIDAVYVYSILKALITMKNT